jgi:hypothetical protein
MLSIRDGRSSGAGTTGISDACSTPGSTWWNDADSEKMALPR